MNKLVQMGIDLYEGKITNFSREESNEAYRKALLEICGGEIDRKSFRKHSAEIFALMEETLDAIIPKVLDSQFDMFVETKNVAWGDQLIFDIEDPSMFKIATIADGTKNLRRQSLDNGSLTLSTSTKGVKVGSDLYRFLAGKDDFNKMVNRVADSFALQIKVDVFNAFVNSFSGLDTTYGISGAFDKTKFMEIIAHVEAASGLKAAVYGTKVALSQVTASADFLSDRAKDEVQRQGYVGSYLGTDLVEISQVHKAGTDDFVVNNKQLIVVPVGASKIVKLGFEGDAIIDEEQGTAKADLSKEYVFLKKYGTAVVAPSKYGVYTLA
jgi:hypothetical protein